MSEEQAADVSASPGDNAAGNDQQAEPDDRLGFELHYGHLRRSRVSYPRLLKPLRTPARNADRGRGGR